MKKMKWKSEMERWIFIGVELNTRSGNNPAQSAGEQQQQDDAPRTLGHILCRIIVVVVAVVMLIMALSGWFCMDFLLG